MTYQAKANDHMQSMIDEAHRVLQLMLDHGAYQLPEQDSKHKWHRINYAACSADGMFASDTVMGSSATHEVCIDSTIEDGKIGLVLRRYEDGRRVKQWQHYTTVISGDEACSLLAQIMEDNDDLAAAEPTHFPTVKGLVQPSIEQVAREGFKTDGSTSYEQWDAMRRRLLTTVDGYEQVEVLHNEYETVVFYGKYDGNVVASWSQSTGHCRCMTPDQVADTIADGVRNYIRNSLRYSNV